MAAMDIHRPRRDVERARNLLACVAVDHQLQNFAFAFGQRGHPRGDIAARVYGWFAEAANDSAPAPAPLDSVAAQLAERQRDIGPLVSPVARDFDAARAELHAARQQLAWQRAQHARFEALEREAAVQKSVIDQATQALDAILSS